MNLVDDSRGVAYVVLLIWLLFQLARRLDNIPLRSIVGLVVFWLLSYPFNLAAGAGTTVLFNDKLTEQFLSSSADMCAAYCMALFFLFTLYDRGGARRRAVIQLIPLAAAVLAMAIMAIIIPVDQRDAVAQIIAHDVNGAPHSPPPTIGGWFLFVPNIYQVWTYAYALIITCRYIRSGTDRILRQGMIIAAVGLAALAIGFTTYLWANLSTATHLVSIPAPLLVLGILLGLAGIPTFLIGIGWRSGRMRAASVRVWLRHRRVYWQLYPLWEMLHRHFPEDALTRTPAPGWRDAINPTGVHRRYYRRVIECRDGLVRISPYVAQVRHEHGDELPLPEQLRHAFTLHDAGQPVTPTALPLAQPDSAGLAADTAPLVALSRALRNGPS